MERAELLKLRNGIALKVTNTFLDEMPERSTIEEMVEVQLGCIWQFTTAIMTATMDAKMIRDTVDDAIRAGIKYNAVKRETKT